MRPSIRTLLAIGLAIGLVAVFLRNADLSRVWSAIGSARLDLVGAGIVVTMLTYVVRAERWQHLLEPLGHTRFQVAFRTTVIGFAASSVLPARAGELLRPYLLARREGLSATATFATVLVERVLDLVGVLVLLAAYLLLFDPGMAERHSTLFAAVRLGGLVMAPAALVATGVMYALAGHPDWLRVVVSLLERWLPGRLGAASARAIRLFADGFGVLRRPARLALAAGWTLVLWLLIGGETWVVARAVGLDLSFPDSWLMVALLVVGVALPTPGAVGGFHEAFRLGATAFFGADNDSAVGAAILLHAIAFVPVTLLGLWYAAREGLDMRGLGRLATATAEVKA